VSSAVRKIFTYKTRVLVTAMGIASTMLTIWTRHQVRTEHARTRAEIEARIDELRLEVLASITEANDRAARAEDRAHQAEARAERISGINDLVMERFTRHTQPRTRRQA